MNENQVPCYFDKMLKGLKFIFIQWTTIQTESKITTSKPMYRLFPAKCVQYRQESASECLNLN